MDFTLLFLFLYFFIFLFILYALSNDDLLLLRKNVTIEKVFDTAILVSLFGLVSSRIVFVILDFSSNYFNPLVLLLFPYFPGLSLTGGVICSFCFLIFLSRRKKMPVGRMLDLFTISFISTLSIGFFTEFFVELLRRDVFLWVLLGASFALGIVVILFLKFIFPLVKRGDFVNGTTSIMLLIIYCLVILIVNSLLGGPKAIWFFGREDIMVFCFFLVLMVLLFAREKLFSLLFKKN